MTLLTLAGFFLLTTISVHNAEGKNLFLLETDKVSDLKQAEKRGSNFRVNVETPFDPNFWPARGRRGRRNFEKSDNCIAADDYLELQCQPETGGKESDPDNNLDSGTLPEKARVEGDCYGNLVELKAAGSKRSSASDEADPKPRHGLNEFMSNKRRRQRVLPLSRLMAYGNGLYEPNNPLGEKMKKQDVFWVVRGKKNSH